MSSAVTPEPSPGRWQEIERVYHDARVLDPTERAAFLAATCGADADLLREVESLLKYETAAGDYLERPALEESAKSLVLDRGPLAAGRAVAGYEIVSLLGAGGMGEVYRARDMRLERDVALKVLERSVALDPGYLRRFEEEARAASGLTHPNIVTIYGVGEDEDLAYIAMELVRGRTLRELLVAGEVTVGLAIDIAAQLADALAAAHDAGIVHRDLKPENLMVTPDQRVKVLDFGIARRHLHVGSAPTSDAVTTGIPVVEREAIVGTVGYMSPEQAAGRPADHRSDQFAFGAILYEMLCGRRAFVRSTTAATLDAIIAAQPMPALKANPAVPKRLREVMDRCLAKSPDHRYLRTRDLAMALQPIREEWRHEHARGGLSRRRVLVGIGASAAVAAAAAITWDLWPRGPIVRSLAVLPFANGDGNAEIEYLCDGITESLIRRIAFVPDLDVRSRSAVFNFKRANQDARSAGRQLRVDVVLTGSVSFQAGTLLVTTRLLDVATGADVWTGRYERRADDLLALQHELASAIVDEGIRRPLVASARRRFDREITEDGEANNLYLRGLYLHRLGGERNYLSASNLLKQAVTKDETFAIAHVSLASTYTAMTVDGFTRPTEAWPRSNRSVRRALEIDPELPEAHAEQSSFWFFFNHDWDAAEREWGIALRAGSSPTLPDLLSASALKLWAVGRVDDALALARRARGLDALTPAFAAQEADLLLHARRMDEADRAYTALLARVPEDASAWHGLAEVRRAQGQFDLAIDARRRAYGSPGDEWPEPFVTLLANARGEVGYRAIDRAAAALEIDGLNARRARGAYVSPLDFARGYAQLGQPDRAFEYLDAAFDDAAPGLVFLKVDRAWESVRHDDRFVAAVAEVGLP